MDLWSLFLVQTIKIALKFKFWGLILQHFYNPYDLTPPISPVRVMHLLVKIIIYHYQHILARLIIWRRYLDCDLQKLSLSELWWLAQWLRK